MNPSTKLLSNGCLSIVALICIVSPGLFASGCDSGNDTPAGEVKNAGDAAESGNRNGTTGTITIGENAWEVVPSVQCGVYPGGVVSIAGHAAGDEGIEIVLDHDPSSGLISAYVKGLENSPYWVAKDDNVSFEVDGRNVIGTGTFSLGPGASVAEGQPRELEGRFEVGC